MLTALAGRIYTKLNLGSLKGWLLAWLLLTLFYALAPVLLSVIYCGIVRPSDFSQAPGPLRANELRWSFRIGTESSSSSNAGFVSWDIGVNVEDPMFTRAIAEIKDGTLREVRQATYLGWLREDRWPVIFTTVREMRTDGEITFMTSPRRKAPLLYYLCSSAFFGALTLICLSILNIFNKRKNATA